MQDKVLLKLQVLYRQPVIDQLLERINPDAEVAFDKMFGDTRIADRSFDPFGNHRLI